MVIPMALLEAANQRWSLDFVSNALTNGRRFRVLAVVDDCKAVCKRHYGRLTPLAAITRCPQMESDPSASGTASRKRMLR